MPNWANYTGFGLPNCLPCCVTPTPPTVCGCVHLIPYAFPYASYVAAEAGLADSVADCLVYHEISPASTVVASFNGTTLAIDIDNAVGVNSLVFGKLALKAGICSFAFARTATGSSQYAAANLWDCIRDVYIGGGSSGATNGTFAVTIPADGEYYFELDLNSNATPFDGTWTITSSDVFWISPVIARWDDSGTERKLWACPKLLLPPLTEATGTWYASCAAAAAVLTDPLQVSNCVGFSEGGPGLSSFTATDGGTSLTLATSGVNGVATWGSVNCEAGKTINVAGIAGAGTVTISVRIYDDTGTLIEDSGTISSPFVSAVLSYTGRYTVRVVVLSTDNGASTSATITSSGTMSVNEIQALYDIGLTCPARLDCGAGCP